MDDELIKNIGAIVALIVALITVPRLIIQTYLNLKEVGTKRTEGIKDLFADNNNRIYIESVFLSTQGVLLPYDVIKRIEKSDHPVKLIKIIKNCHEFVKWDHSSNKFISSRKLNIKYYLWFLSIVNSFLLLLVGFLLYGLFQTKDVAFLLLSLFFTFLMTIVYMGMTKPSDALKLIHNQFKIE